jgi:hypothetical protein
MTRKTYRLLLATMVVILAASIAGSAAIVSMDAPRVEVAPAPPGAPEVAPEVAPAPRPAARPAPRLERRDAPAVPYQRPSGEQREIGLRLYREYRAAAQLSPEQERAVIDTLADLAISLRQQMFNDRHAHRRPAAAEANRLLHEQATDELAAVLTPEQLATYRRMFDEGGTFSLVLLGDWQRGETIP